jgi:hypothetical protein
MVGTSNLTDALAAVKLESWLARLREADLEDLFVEQVLRAAEGDGSQSGLGFITIAKDHGARVDVTVSDGPRPGVKKVDVQAIFSTEEVGSR